MWILIAVFVTTATGDFGIKNGVSFQEFATKESCETAITVVRDLRTRPADRGDSINMRCVKK